MKGQRAATVAVAVALAIAPALATLALVGLHLDASVRDFVPSAWNDQTGYWTYVLGFSEAGFDTGYYTPYEQPAAIEAIHFDVHGPAFQVVYGSVAAVVGWNLWASIPFNLVAVALGFVAYALIARLDRRQVLVAGALLLTFWPVLLYAVTSSQESLHQAIALVLAGLFAGLLARPGRASVALAVALVVLLLAAALIRFSWALLLVPALLLALRPRGPLAVGAVLVAGAGLIVGVIALAGAMAAPGGNLVLTSLEGVFTTPGETIPTLVKTTWSNFKWAIDPPTFEVSAPQNLAAMSMETVQLLGVLIVAVVAAVIAWRRRPAEAAALREWGLQAFNLGLVLVAALLVYIPRGYYRLFAAHLLLSLMIAVARRRWAIAGAVIAANLLVTVSFLDMYGGWRENFDIPGDRLARERAQLHRLVRFDPQAPSPWCNTLLITLPNYNQKVTLVPAGIGVSYVASSADGLPRPPRSHWLLVDPAPESPLRPVVAQERMERVARLPYGELYRNPRSGCRA